jgi:hypothetical protein
MSVTIQTDEEKFEELFGRGDDDLDGAIRNEENTVCLGTYGDDLKQKNRQITWDYTLASVHPEVVQDILAGETEVVDLWPVEAEDATVKTRIQKDYFEKAEEFFDIDLRENKDAIYIHPEWNFIAVIKPDDSEKYLAIAPVVYDE